MGRPHLGGPGQAGYRNDSHRHGWRADGAPPRPPGHRAPESKHRHGDVPHPRHHSVWRSGRVNSSWPQDGGADSSDARRNLSGSRCVRALVRRGPAGSGARSIGGAQRPHQSQGDGDRAGRAQQQFTWRGTAFGVAGRYRRADHCSPRTRSTRPRPLETSGESRKAKIEQPRHETEPFARRHSPLFVISLRRAPAIVHRRPSRML